MSMRVMTWVWTQSKSKNGARLVLLAIADAASDDGTNAWPAVKTLMGKANLSERAVQSAIKDLIAMGELKVDWNKGRNGSNRYTVLMPTPAESAPPQNLHPADIAGGETGPEADSIPQDPPQNLHPAESAPPQISTPTPAESAPKPNTNHKNSSSSSKKTPAAPTTKRGTRIPDDFALTDAMREWGRLNAPAIDGERETERFIDYWRAQPGARGVKLDWIATWRNWIRTAADRLATDTGGAQGANTNSLRAQQARFASAQPPPYGQPADSAAAACRWCDKGFYERIGDGRMTRCEHPDQPPADHPAAELTRSTT